jgi:phage gp46-like protein
MTPSGTRLQFTGGQPLMDRGLENLALISLFTSPGWAGNLLVKSDIGSDFEAVCNQPITRRSLNDIRNSAERALKSPAFGRVTVTVTNPTGYRLNVIIRIEPPGDNPQAIQLTRNGENWTFQAMDPAFNKVN